MLRVTLGSRDVVARNLRPAIHGDGIATVGGNESLPPFEEAFGGKLEASVRARPDPEKTGATSVRILNRIAEWRPDGIGHAAH